MTWPQAQAVVTSASLRARLVFLALLIMLPLVGVLLVGAVAARDDVLQSAQLRALDLAERGAEQQGEVLREAQTLLTVMSRLPDLRADQPDRCRAQLAQLVADHPHIVEFALIDARGETICTNRSVLTHISMMDKPYIGRLLAPGGHGFDHGELSISRTSGIPTLYVGLALPPPAGTDRPGGVLVAGLNLEWLSSLAARVVHGTGSIALLMHVPDGTVLARHPDNAQWVGRVIGNGPIMSALRQNGGKAGYTAGIASDGVARLYGFAPLPGMVDSAVLAIGFDRAEVLARANERMVIALGIALAAMLVAATAAYFAAWQMVIRPVARIMETARRLGRGDLHARVALPRWHAPELQTFAGTLNTMAEDFSRSLGELSRSEAEFRLLTDHASDMVARIGPDGVPRYLSPAAARIFGRPVGAVLERNIVELIHPDDQAGAFALQSQLLSGAREEGVYSYRVPHPDGKTRWIEATLRAVRAPATGVQQGYVSVARDVTERVQLEREREHRALEMEISNAQLERLARHLARARDRAERASQAKSRFLAGMSHELRTPLNGLLGYTQLLRMEGGLNPVQAARIEAMMGAGSHLLQMINCVLDLSEIEANQVDLHMEESDPRGLAEACLDLVRPMAEAKGLALHLSIAAEVSPSVTTDLTRLRQVLLNLLGNAVKFTARGSVTLRLLAVGDGSFRIEVADTGPGVPTERRHRLFQDFERLHTAETSMIEGAGLGLAITARLVTLMGGRVGYEDNPGGGSVFWLELPNAGAAIGVETPERPAAEPTDEGQPALRILVVDDVAMNRDIAGTFLSAAGHDVTFADGGGTAVALATECDFDVILMDVRMPEIDGIEASRRIRALRGPRSGVPIVALTAQAFADQIAQCNQAGMDSHLSKPFAPHTLLDVVLRAAAKGPRSEHSMVATDPQVTPTQAALGAELPVIDPAVFERTCAYLPAAIARTYLQSIAERGKGLLQDLRAEGDLRVPNQQLAEAAHALAGSIGMFGFERLSVMGRRFEHSVQTGGQNATVLAQGLDAALEDALQEVERRMPVLMPA